MDFVWLGHVMFLIFFIAPDYRYSQRRKSQWILVLHMQHCKFYHKSNVKKGKFTHLGGSSVKSLTSCKLTLSLINVLSFRITTDQHRTLNESIYAVHQSFSGFNTGGLGRPHSAQLSLVVWELALTCDGSPLFAISATLAWILLSLVVAGLYTVLLHSRR